MVTTAQTTSSPQPPQVGSLIDNDALELVEILGYGGYGIVYRAIDTYSSHPTSYAVKCLPHSTKRNAVRQRQLHMREITLHQLASRHPGVVTLHRVIEDPQYTWIVMDYCPDGDLFTQILHNRRYLGNNDLIKDVFLQLLDAVEYCHSMSIYHRDLKPENVLCFNDGLRLAITDFGLATTEKMSTEFRTGSVYHMSPGACISGTFREHLLIFAVECQGGEFSPTKSYSPLFNDIWSLGIILLNLITGRNPWKSASPDDCTFQAYLRDPAHFLPTVLPISQEVNALLVRTLEVDWRHRITLLEMKEALLKMDNFYSKDVLFEDSMARCPWEAGVNVDDDEDSGSTAPEVVQEVIPEPQPEVEIETREFHDAAENARWVGDSDSEMVFAPQPSASAEYSWDGTSSYAKAGAVRSPSRSLSPSPSMYSQRGRYDGMRTPSGPSLYSLVSSSPSIPSPPLTPGPDDAFFINPPRRPAHLTIDINGLQPDYYAANVDMLSARSSAMQTALESAHYDYDSYTSFYITESEKMVTSPQDTAMITTPSDYEFDEDEMEEMDDALSTYSYPTIDTYETVGMTEDTVARPESPVLGLDFGFPESETTAVDLQATFNWSAIPSQSASTQATPAFSFLTFTNSPNASSQVEPSSFQPTPHLSHAHDFGTTLGSSCPTPPAASSTPTHAHSRSDSRSRSRSRKSRLLNLNPVRLAFTRRSRSPSPTSFLESTGGPAQPEASQPSHQQQFITHWELSTSISPQHPPSLSRFASPVPSPARTPPTGSATSTSVQEKSTAGMRRRTTKRRLRSAKDWFSPGRLFAAVMPSP